MGTPAYLAAQTVGSSSPRKAISCSTARIAACSLRARSPASQRALDLLHAIAFDDITNPHVLVILERHAAFLPGLHFLDLVLEALQGRELAFMHHDIVADEPHMGAALNRAVGDPAARDLAHLGNHKDFQDFGIAKRFLAQGRREEA